MWLLRRGLRFIGFLQRSGGPEEPATVLEGPVRFQQGMGSTSRPEDAKGRHPIVMLECRPARVGGCQALPRMRLRFVPHTGHFPLAMRRPLVSTTLPVASRFSLHFTQ